MYSTLSFLVWDIASHDEIQDQLVGGRKSEGRRVLADTVANVFATVATTVGVVASGRLAIKEIVLGALKDRKNV